LVYSFSCDSQSLDLKNIDTIKVHEQYYFTPFCQYKQVSYILNDYNIAQQGRFIE